MTSPTPLTLAAIQAMPTLDRARAFLHWLKQQPADVTYLPGSFTGCALAQFGATFGCPRAGTFAVAGPGWDWISILPYVDVLNWTTRPSWSYTVTDEGVPTRFSSFATHLEAELARLAAQGEDTVS